MVRKLLAKQGNQQISLILLSIISNESYLELFHGNVKKWLISMSKITSIGVLLVTLGACSLSGVKHQAIKNPSYYSKSQNIAMNVKEMMEQDGQSTDALLWSRLQNGLSWKIPMNEPKVQKHIQLYGQYPKELIKIAHQASPYLFLIIEELERRNMPIELAFLPMIESAYQPFAISYMGAGGIWQIMPVAGKRFGLKQDNWYDGRFDVMASTEAALDYLQYLYEYFDNDWHLALAAYNSGEGTVRKAIYQNQKKNLPTDFWNLPLPQQTKDYVPKLLALLAIFKDHEEYGITLPDVDNKEYVVAVEVDNQIDIQKAAKLADMDAQELYQLNPGFSQWITHPRESHDLLMPVANAAIFKNRLKKNPEEIHVVWHRHKIKQGESLITVANRYKISPEAIRRANNLASNKLKPGTELKLPGAASLSRPFVHPLLAQKFKKSTRATLIAQKKSRTKSKKVKTTLLAAKKSTPSRVHVVRSGDSLWSISAKYNVSVQKLKKINALSTKPLRLGQKLRVVS